MLRDGTSPGGREETSGQAISLDRLSHRVVRRLALARWFRALGRSALVLYPLAAAVAVGLWLAGIGRVHVIAVLVLVALQIAISGVWTWLRRPSPVAGLAYWDRRAGRQEMFASAWCFEAAASDDDGQRLHVVRALRALPEAAANLRRELPAPLPHRAWMLPALLLVLVPLLPPPPAAPGEPTVDDEARAAAQEVAAALDQRNPLADTAKGLTPAEEKDLKKLKTALEQTAEHLRKLKNEARRDVLGELEQRAHEADKLAESLQSSADDMAGSKLVAELERHADTTDLASALRAKDLDKSGAESQKLGQRLDQKDISLEERKRIEQALDKALKAADKEELVTRLAKHLDRAKEELKANDPKKAAQQFQQLAKHFAQTLQRQNTQRQLQQLARQLRNSGQQIFGQQQGSISRLAQNPNVINGNLRMVNGQPVNMQQWQQGMLAIMPGTPPPGAQPLYLLNGGTNPPNGPVMLGPVPGDGQGPMFAMDPGSCPIPGSGQIPVPGADGQGGLGGSGMSAPVPGSNNPTGPIMQSSGGGGLHAGRGTADIGNTATQSLAAQKTGVVRAAPTGQGPSQQRNVEGGHRAEEARRQSQKLAADFIKAEEDALADEPLPVSRRQQVLRYFTALRSQFVEPQPSGKPAPGNAPVGP